MTRSEHISHEEMNYCAQSNIQMKRMNFNAIIASHWIIGVIDRAQYHNLVGRLRSTVKFEWREVNGGKQSMRTQMSGGGFSRASA